MWVLVLEGIAIGTLLGLTGAGGGILAVPALMASQGWSVAQAAPVGLIAVTMSAFISTIQGFIQHVVRYRAAIWIAILAIPFAHLGVICSQFIPKMYMTLLFSCVMFFVAYRLFFKQNVEQPNPLCKLNPNTGRFIWNKKTAVILGCVGIFSGFLTGLLGVGGGFVIVPVLKRITDLSMKSIISTSLMIIGLIGSFTIILHLLEGFCYPKTITTVFVFSCVVGLLVGKQLLNIIPTQVVQRIFALTVVCVASSMFLTAIQHFV